MAAQALMKRGKRSMAVYVKEECLRPTGHPQLTELLNYLLDPVTPLSDFERIDWCRWLIAGGETFEEFVNTVKKYDYATTCGLVWTADFVAYRCRTCGISPCMSLCSDCFQAGDHTGHDFNMFRSQAGGACDCGDVNVMSSDGFCPRHGPSQTEKPKVPSELVSVPEVMMPRFLWWLVQHLRDSSTPDLQGTFVQSMPDVEQFLNFLHQLSEMGAAMRDVMTRVLTDPDVYAKLKEAPVPMTEYQLRTRVNYQAALDSITPPAVPEEFQDIPELNKPLEHNTLLDELLFWVVKFEFPQKMVTLLLSFLPDDNYKGAFTKAFVQHYSRISCALVSSINRNRISNRVVHISVQLLSPEVLACEMVQKYKLLYIMLTCLRYMIEGVLTTSGLHECSHSTQLVVDCSREVLKEHCYWPIVSDFINILSHKSIAKHFLTEHKLLRFWFELIAYFQGMNVNHRELDQHVNFEPETYYAAFSAELEICASTMWSMVVHCMDKETKQFTKTVVSILLELLKEWFDGIGLRPYSTPYALQASFHLPLHRHLAVFLSHGVRYQGLLLRELLPPPDMLQMVMIHLLQLQVAYHEIFAGMWVRNGLQIKGQAMTYVQCHFCNSMVDADLYLLQVCANSLDPDHFIRTVLERFHVLDLLTFIQQDSPKKMGFLEADKQMPMLEGVLMFLSMLLGVRTQLGLTDEEITRLEMVTLLCTNDRTHSQLVDSLPEKCGLSGQVKDFDSTLQSVSQYKAPVFESGGSMQQGMYLPKNSVWEEDFDPIYVFLRAMYKKDFQNSMDRFTDFAKQHHGYKGNRPPWPPFRVPGDIVEEYKNLRKLVHCRTMHAVLFTLLYKALHDKTISDSVIYFTVHLLELALSIPNPSHSKTKIPVSECRPDKSFSTWYSVDDIHVNLRTVIPHVAVTVQSISTSNSPREEVDRHHEGLFTLAPSAMSTQAGIVTTSIQHPGIVVGPEGTSSEVINAVQALLEETASQADEHDVPAGPSGCSTPSGRVRSMGVSTKMETRWKTRNLEVGESMLTLLLQLYRKLSEGGTGVYVPEEARPSTSKEGGTAEKLRIGDGAYFVGLVLDKVCGQCADNRRLVTQAYTDSLPKETPGGGAKKKKMADVDERRKKAKARQQKIMADFASRQKSFIEKMSEELSQGECDEDMGEEDKPRPLMEERLYDCVICNQNTSSSNDKPMGLVALMQSSSVLGHRRHSSDVQVLPVSDSMSKHHLSNSATESETRVNSLLHHFSETSCLMSINIGWQGGILVQTCGHYVHLECQKAYLDSLKTQSQSVLQGTVKGEFACPLCRHLSNSAIPILPEVGPALTHPLPSTHTETVRYIADVMYERPITPGSNILTTAMGVVMEDLTKSTDPRFKTCVQSQSAEGVLLFVCSVLRCNLEAELVQRSGSPCLPLPALASKKSCLLPMLHVLSMHSKILTTKPYTDLWYHIAGGHPAKQDSTSVQLHQKEVPVLLKDPTSLLIQFVLTMPATMDKEIYRYFCQALYNLVYLQALVKVSLKFSEEERMAWRSKVKHVSQTDNHMLEGLMGQVISHLFNSGLYEDDMTSDPHVPTFCCSVWSPQSVESEVQQFCLPFLRTSSLLQHHLYGDDLPELNTQECSVEFKCLSTYLGLTPSVTSTDNGDLLLNSASCVQWLCDEPKLQIQGWCSHLKQFVNKDHSAARMLVSLDPTWHVPRFFELPKHYDKIFQYYRRKQCIYCNTLPKDPAICLMCGRLLCFKEKCCAQLNKYECVQHSVTCGGGVGIFLIIQSSFVVVIRGPRATIWGSVYLDEHGEEDRDLKRGKPLFLCEERYRLLEQQWLSHSFDRVCKKWIFHKDLL